MYLERVVYMEIVEPIRSKEKIEEMKIELKKSGTRDYLLFLVGINTGLRASDLVKLQVKDILNQDRTPRKHINITEKKTKKLKKFPINGDILPELLEYCRGLDLNDYLFSSRKGDNKPITTTQCYRIIREAGERIGLTNLGSHTCRKTFGYHFYRKTKDVALLQTLFNHSAPSITLRYIGISQDNIDEAYNNFSL